MFEVLHSSAGAGKTHALVKHYLGHCLQGDDHGAYRQVLALTFTNKAAAEMKERVLGYLENLAQGHTADGPMRDVLDHLTARSGVDGTVLARRADAVLGHMLHHWSDVAISTIDAFTRRVVRPFARDLRLDHDLKITTEQAWYRERAVESLIQEAGNDERITTLLSQTCLQLLHDERSWDPSKPLLELSEELLKESSIGPLQRSRAFAIEDLASLRERLNNSSAQFRRQVNSLGMAALELFERNGIAEDDVSYTKNGIYGYFRKMARFSDMWVGPGPNVLAPVESGKWHSSKAPRTAITALEGIAGRLTELFREAEALRVNGLRDHLIQRAVARELLPAFALHELDAKLEALKQEDGVAFFSDLTRRIAEVVKDEPVPFIYERLGERYRHFLIDEFQDTSLLQWNALLPLIENALATGGSTLLVGDAKQAIYRWRNGEVRLFVKLPEVFGRSQDDAVEAQREATLMRHYREGERLDQNRRSDQAIIAFNNALFGTLKDILPGSLRPVYGHHAQRSSRSGQGVVAVVSADPDLRGEALQRAILDHALRCLEDALAAGSAPGDVAILVRSKRTGRAVAAHLLQHGHAVVSPDGSQLAADPAIQLLVEWLRFMQHGDAVTALRVLQWQAMIAARQGAADDQGVPHPIMPFRAGGMLPDPVELLSTWLKDHGRPRLRTTVAALVTELARAHGLVPAEDAAVLTFLDEVHAWTKEHGQDIAGFLEHWERTGGERSTTATDHGQAVQVMTVHKSKGLQFPVVIVPDARMTVTGTRGNLFWVDPGDAVPELDIALIRESAISRAAELPELKEEEDLRILDALDLLYVAFTRPEQRLYAFVPHSNDAVTRGLLDFVATHGELARSPNMHETPRSSRVAHATSALRDVTPAGSPPDLTIRSEASRDWDPEDPDPFRGFGNAVHAALAETRIPEDLGPALRRAVDRNELTAEQAAGLHDRLGSMISTPELSPWFAPHLDVRTEATLINARGHSLRPDRLVLEGDRVRVLEIKTGRPSEMHAGQVRTYMDLLRAMGYERVEGSIWYLTDGRIIPVA